MPGVADILREIHRLRRHAREMQQELDRAPIVLKAHRTKAEKIQAATVGSKAPICCSIPS